MSKSEENEKSSVSTNIILGYIAVKDFKTISEKISVLNSLGFCNAEMAIVCDTSPGNIRKEKSKLKKK